MTAILEFIFLTGLSGAGKSTALKAFEDLGFFCIDNLPSILLPTFVELCQQSSEEFRKVAIGIDIREGTFLKNFPNIYKKLKESQYNCKLIFFDASDEVLVKRYIETRRPHPLAFNKPVIEGVIEEKKRLEKIKELADQIIDTTNFSVHDLRSYITQLYPESKEEQRILINIISFGYKFGIPYEADLVFDVRFLPNPFFVPELKNLSGNDSAVMNFVLSKEITKDFIEHLKTFLSFLIPQYVKEGKKYLTIAFGCTGGKHRSVCIAEVIQKYLFNENYIVELRHRDITKF